MGGGSSELRSRALRGTATRGFWGQNDAGLDRVLTQDETRRGTAPRWLTVATPLLRARTTVSGVSDTLLTSKNSSTPSSWPPLASADHGLARAAVR
jgi:hypothetical protein